MRYNFLCAHPLDDHHRHCKGPVLLVPAELLGRITLNALLHHDGETALALLPAAFNRKHFQNPETPKTTNQEPVVIPKTPAKARAFLFGQGVLDKKDEDVSTKRLLGILSDASRLQDVTSIATTHIEAAAPFYKAIKPFDKALLSLSDMMNKLDHCLDQDSPPPPISLILNQLKSLTDKIDTATMILITSSRRFASNSKWPPASLVSQATHLPTHQAPGATPTRRALEELMPGLPYEPEVCLWSQVWIKALNLSEDARL
ncbi:hypothetical protein CTheo_8685 [Ceratobasidium theobromae]|uniref:Uncharacterized protein n=1 Tax=Ceratobasidium theobromae TaxID=1582974 RepID=A0A5N5Q7Z2_9AGAM|nr:hypothetical protein CTheo_8685 [Ceratobasidium theobromae]